ncbi:lactonase family protein [Macrococcoides caseolyticum]|uniref:6-phosphogluconolactonase n=1 Tax=Macrococcoides caseolyticum TaxID=69966 RepID=UPI001F2F2172|nr:lactonase family protein [Macrococcus caseolyticus]MCE4957446.1 lactonase family protein [Macrococcus caseolyticus]
MSEVKGWIGSYTKQDGKGIYSFTLDTDKKTIKDVETAYEVPASTYVMQHGDKLYGIKKVDNKAGIQSYQIKSDGRLEVINDNLSSTDSACHIWVTRDGKYLLEAVYGPGLVRLYRLDEQTGEVLELIDVAEQEGTGPNQDRQDHAHTHYVQETPDGKYAVAVDLGTDEVITFTFGTTGLKRVHTLKVEPGMGPRHLVFNDNGKYAYLFTELSNDVVVLKYDDGVFTMLSKLSSIPNDFTENTQGAAIRLSHDGKYLYASNRGHQSIAVFKVLGEGEAIERVEIVSCGGDWPRDFNIDPSDRFLVCAHEVDGVLSLFERNVETGKLTLLENDKRAPEGVCVQFL